MNDNGDDDDDNSHDEKRRWTHLGGVEMACWIVWVTWTHRGHRLQWAAP
jgi:hypothetical protein